MDHLPTLALHVLAARGRTDAHERLRLSLAVSDARDLRQTWHVHPEGLSVREHLVQSYERIAAEPGGELVLVLEDDAIVCRHLAHNLQTWAAPWDPAFGAGWAYNPGGYAGKDCWYDAFDWYGTVAVLYRAKSLPHLVRTLRERPQPQEPFDVELSRAITTTLGQIRVAFPSLVEHPDDLPSVVGNAPHADTRTSRGTFDPDFYRGHDDPAALFDEWQRPRVPCAGERVWETEGPPARS